jgi:beta-galactosidase
MCGFKKPIGWFRQSLWSDAPMVYLCVSNRVGRRSRGLRGAEHWNWTEGQRVTVLCCTNCPEVALTLNDRSLGILPLSEANEGVLRWEIPYEPGMLKAVGRRAGQDVCEFVLQTAGPASRVVISSDATQLRADGSDTCHLEFCLVDDRGVRVPDAEQQVIFDLEGPGRIIGIENGDLNSLDDPKDHIHKAYRGRGLAILQAQRQTGRLRVTARSQGLTSASIEIDVR